LADVLPPNVYYLEVPTSAGARRAKCTAISRADFELGVRRWFHPYLWGRFSQPVSLAYARDADARDATLSALCDAVSKFVEQAACLRPSEFATQTLWTDGLRTSYSTELRSEGPDRAVELYAAHADYYEALTGAVADAIGLSAIEPGRWRSAMSARDRRQR